MMSPATPQPTAIPIQAPRDKPWLEEWTDVTNVVEEASDAVVADESGEGVELWSRLELEEGRVDGA